MEKALSKMGAGALYLQSLGFAIIPIRAGSKVPAIEGGVTNCANDEAGIRAWWESHPNDNVAVATGEPSGNVVVVDIDVDEDSGLDGNSFIRSWEKRNGALPETVCVTTPRGGTHMYYRLYPDEHYRNHVGRGTTEGVDVRGDGGYVLAPPSVGPWGNCYDWDGHPDDVEIAWADDNVIALLDVLGEHSTSYGTNPYGGVKFELPERIHRGERNDTLFRYACSLQSKGYSDADLEEAVNAANLTHCDHPLRDGEVRAIVRQTERYPKGEGVRKTDFEKNKEKRDEQEAKAGKADSAQEADPDDNLPPWLKGKRFHHDKLADAMIGGKERVRFISGIPAVWQGGYYRSGWDEVQRAMIRRMAGITKSQRSETISYLSLTAPRFEQADTNIIVFSNKAVNIVTGDTYATTPNDNVMNVLPHEYAEDTKPNVVDEFLDSLACGRADVRANMEEAIGLCMYRSNRYAISLVLLGGGNNGKSTFIDAINFLLGDDNVASLDVRILGERFQAAQLAGKLANLADDISNEFLDGSKLAVFKKVAAGNKLYTDVKGVDGFEFRPYCTVMISSNDFPRLGDNTDGVMRRLYPIPFDANFKDGGDPFMGEKLATEEAAQRLAALGIAGLRRVIESGGHMTESDHSAAKLRDIKTENDTFAQWADDECIGIADVDGTLASTLYQSYALWCGESGVKKLSKQSFGKRVRPFFGVRSVVERPGGRSARVYRRN